LSGPVLSGAKGQVTHAAFMNQWGTAVSDLNAGSTATAAHRWYHIDLPEEEKLWLEVVYPDDYFPHDDDLYIEDLCARKALKDFVVTITYHNPYETTFANWDYGIVFRKNGEGKFYYLSINSNGTWDIHYASSPDGEQSGTVPSLKLGAGEANKIMFIARGVTGSLTVNNVHIADVKLGHHLESGLICAAIGLHKGDEKEGERTYFEDFTIWSFVNP